MTNFALKHDADLSAYKKFAYLSNPDLSGHINFSKDTTPVYRSIPSNLYPITLTNRHYTGTIRLILKKYQFKQSGSLNQDIAF